MNEKVKLSWEDWIKTRPECVQKLAVEFPVGTIVDIDEVRLYLIGYTEEDALIFSPIDPNIDYPLAKCFSVYIPAADLRNRDIFDYTPGESDAVHNSIN